LIIQTSLTEIRVCTCCI